MKKIISIIVILLVVYLLFPKPYISSPGHVTREMYAQFELTKSKCFGYGHLTNAMAVAADASGQSLCFGLLVK